MLLEAIKNGGHKAAVHLSDDKVLSMMLEKLCEFHKIQLINIENDEKKDFQSIQPTIMIVGSFARSCEVFNLLKENSELLVYKESEFINGINPAEIMYKGKKIRGINFAK